MRITPRPETPSSGSPTPTVSGEASGVLAGAMVRPNKGDYTQPDGVYGDSRWTNVLAPCPGCLCAVLVFRKIVPNT